MVLFQGAAAADQGPVAATLERATTEVIALTAQQLSSVAADTHAENALGTTGHLVALAGFLDIHGDGGPAGQRHPGRRQHQVCVRP